MQDIFDNTKPNIILLADHSEPLFMVKSYGVSRVASELRLHGYEVSVLHHLHVFKYEELKYILKQLISDQTLYVGVSNFFYKDVSGEYYGPNGEVFWPYPKPGTMLPHGHDNNKDFKEFVQTCNPKCKLVLGGPISGDGEYNREFDYCVQGYADRSAINLADHLSRGAPLNKSYRSIHGMTVIKDIKADGFEIETSKHITRTYDCVLPGETLSIEIARGCIFKCSFCSYPFNGKSKNDFIRHEELIYQEFMDNYEKFGVTRYTFSDDTFNDSPQKSEMINRVSKRLPFKLEFWAYTRLDLLAKHKHTIDLLVEAGQRAFYFGIETWNKKSGQAVGKGLAWEKQYEALRYIKDRVGDEVMLHGNFIVGLPHETVESLNRTVGILERPNFPIDSALFLNFTMENTNNFTFNSEIALNPEKFGYEVLEVTPITKTWRNEHMDYDQAEELAKDFNVRIQSLTSKINGLTSFYMAGLGFDLEFSVNKPIKDFPFNKVWDQKQLRAKQYRKLVYTNFNIEPLDDTLDQLPDPVAEYKGGFARTTVVPPKDFGK